DHTLTQRADGGIGTHGELLLSEATKISIFPQDGAPRPHYGLLSTGYQPSIGHPAQRLSRQRFSALVKGCPHQPALTASIRVCCTSDSRHASGGRAELRSVPDSDSCSAASNVHGQAWIFGLRLTLAHAWAPGTTYCVQRLRLVLSLRPPDHVSFKPRSILHRFDALEFLPAGGRRGGGRAVGWRHIW